MYYTQINHNQGLQNDNTTSHLFEEVITIGGITPTIHQHQNNSLKLWRGHEPINQHTRNAAFDIISGNSSIRCVETHSIYDGRSRHYAIAQMFNVHDDIQANNHMINNQYHQPVIGVTPHKEIIEYDEMPQFLFDNKVMALLQEIYINLRWRINPIKMYQTIYNKKHDYRHMFMKKHNLGLNNSEFISILLWSSSERLTKQYHIDCENDNKYKWKLFINALTNGVKKICKAAIINEISDDSVNVFHSSLPAVLYRGTTYFKPDCDKWNLHTILSFTSSLSVAKTFAALGVNAEGHRSYILCVNNFVKHLLNGELIAAPINWLSSYDHEEEWIVLPSIVFNVNLLQTDNGDVYELLIMSNHIRNQFSKYKK